MEGKDIERNLASARTIKNLRRIADALEAGVPVRIRVNGRRIRIPADAGFDVDFQREHLSGKVEIDLRWGSAGSKTDGRSRRRVPAIVSA